MRRLTLGEATACDAQRTWFVLVDVEAHRPAVVKLFKPTSSHARQRTVYVRVFDRDRLADLIRYWEDVK